MQKIVVAVDQTVPVGAELAIIADGAASPAPVAAAAPAPVVETPAPVVETPAPVAQAPVAPVAPASETNNGAGTVITMPA